MKSWLLYYIQIFQFRCSRVGYFEYMTHLFTSSFDFIRHYCRYLCLRYSCKQLTIPASKSIIIMLYCRRRNDIEVATLFSDAKSWDVAGVHVIVLEMASGIAGTSFYILATAESSCNGSYAHTEEVVTYLTYFLGHIPLSR